jgi:hypothetical protein
VLHQVYALTTEDVANGVGGLSANLYPVEGTLEIQIYGSGIGIRIVHTNLLSETTITWCTSVSDHDTINGVAFATTALQSDFCCHFFVVLFVKFLNFMLLSRNSGCKGTKKMRDED